MPRSRGAPSLRRSPRPQLDPNVNVNPVRSRTEPTASAGRMTWNALGFAACDGHAIIGTHRCSRHMVAADDWPRLHRKHMLALFGIPRAREMARRERRTPRPAQLRNVRSMLLIPMPESHSARRPARAGCSLICRRHSRWNSVVGVEAEFRHAATRVRLVASVLESHAWLRSVVGGSGDFQAIT